MPWNWDPTKNEDNKAKHRVPFEIARRVFRDENASHTTTRIQTNPGSGR